VVSIYSELSSGSIQPPLLERAVPTESKQCFSKKVEGSQRVYVWVEESTDSKLKERKEFNWASNEVASELNYVIPYPIMGPEHACKDIGLKTHNEIKRGMYEDGQNWCCVMDTFKDDYNRVKDISIHLCQMWRAVSESEGFEMGTVVVETHSGRQALRPVEAVGGSEFDGAQLRSIGTPREAEKNERQGDGGDTQISGKFALINSEAFDPEQFVTTFPLSRGESSKPRRPRKMKRITLGALESLSPSLSTSRKMWRRESSLRRGRATKNRDNVSGCRSRLVTPTLSNSITDTNISNCNRRIKGSDKGIEELRLWEIAKEIGVVCQESEDSIIQRFVEMEERDNKVLREANCEDGNMF